jgi:hypothetical protein
MAGRHCSDPRVFRGSLFVTLNRWRRVPRHTLNVVSAFNAMRADHPGNGLPLRSAPRPSRIGGRLGTTPSNAGMGAAREWGWIMRTGELTGTGHRHAGPISKGIVHD